MSEPVDLADGNHTLAESDHAVPTIRAVTVDDITAALRAGTADFAANPGLGLFFGAVYAVGGMAVTAAALAYEQAWFIFPAIAGFTLLGPFVAMGLYEISRRRAQGVTVSSTAVLGAVFRHSWREIAVLGLAVFFAFAVWLKVAGLIYALVFGSNVVTFDALLSQMLTTPKGLIFTVLGNVAGALIALFVFSISVFSFPMLVDRDVDFVTAIVTSLRAVLDNPYTMAGWGILVVVILAVSIAPFFLGLVVALPVLGHATWHLYKRAVA